MATVVSEPNMSRPFLYRSRAWLSLLIIAPTAIVTVFSSPAFDFNDLSTIFLASIGWLFFCSGAFFRWWATLYIGGRKDKSHLICEGPYSVIRHPLYFGTVLIGFSTAFFLQSAVYTVALAVTAVFYLGITLPKEEQALMRIYGDSYCDYMKQVPRFWPNWKNFQTTQIIEVNMQGLWSEFVRTLRWMWVPMLAHLVTHLRHEAWWPHWISIW